MAARQPLLRPTAANEVWSMDFIFDRVAGGRSLKCLRIVDDGTHEAVTIHPEHALGGDHLVPIPPVRQTPVHILWICLLFAAWPFLFAGYTFLGGLGFTVVAFLFLLVFWYLWERTVGFCKRVNAARRRLRAR